MEVSRFRLLFLTCLCATALPGCSWLGLGRDSDEEPIEVPVEAEEGLGTPAAEQPVIDPQVERR